MAKTPTTEISEAKIRNAIWYLKTGKTKKFVCEFLGMPYNTKKLETIIEEFHKKQEREIELKKAAKTKKFTLEEKKAIANQYLAGEAQSTLAKQYYISPQRIKTILMEMNTPIRGRGKKSEAKVDHIVQNLEIKFKPGDKAFLAKYNCYVSIVKVFDEEYLDYLETGRQRYIELYPFKPDKYGMAGKYSEPAQGVHYEIYWVLEDGTEFKLSALRSIRTRIMDTIEETGREYYTVWREDDSNCFLYAMRDELYPIRI